MDDETEGCESDHGMQELPYFHDDESGSTESDSCGFVLGFMGGALAFLILKAVFG